MAESSDQTSLRAGALLPLAQSGISGILCGAVAVSVWALSRSVNGWTVFISAVSAAALIAWIAALRRWRELLNHDHGLTEITQAESAIYPAETVRLEISQNNGAWIDWIDLPLDPERLSKLACELAAGKDLSLANFAGSGKLLSRSEFERLRSELIDRGLARWISDHGHTTGCELTASGRGVMRRLAESRNALTPPARSSLSADWRSLPEIASAHKRASRGD